MPAEIPRQSLKGCVERAIRATEASQKARIIDELLHDWNEVTVDITSPTSRSTTDSPITEPGRPPRLKLVDPRKVGRRGLGSVVGRACFLHAITHIEFNAINLALDITWRFADMPKSFYRDWLGVAADEARHFSLLEGRLSQLGYAYGDFPAHDGLWSIARKTSHDLVSRLAMVPCVLEARGLDVTPDMIERLQAGGDQISAYLLQQILEEEERHVAVGMTWYRWLCKRRNLDPEDTFFCLLEKYLPGRVSGELNMERRRAAGFDPRWLRRLSDYAGVRAKPSDTV